MLKGHSISPTTGPILESNTIFQKRAKKKGKKGQHIWKFAQKCTKFENISKKDSLMRTNIAWMKQLEYALDNS